MVETLIEIFMKPFRKIVTVKAPALQTERHYMSLSKLYGRINEDAAFADCTVAYWDGFKVCEINPTDSTARHFILTVLKGEDEEFEFRLRDAVGGSYVLRTETVVSAVVAMEGAA